MRVLKFGGTSLASSERIHGVASIVEHAARSGPVTVVVSAMAGVTDTLEAALQQALAGAPPSVDRLANQHVACAMAIAETEAADYQRYVQSMLDKVRRLLQGIALLGESTSATRDRILATGERLAAPLVAMTLRRQGMRARAHDGSSLIATGPSGATRVDFTASRDRIQNTLAGRPPTEIAVVTGFVAGDSERRTTTLGRGASDYSATLLGAALDAERVEIWTDVDGVLSAEPRLVPQAFPLPHLTYDEAADLACLGARVLHPQTLEPLASRGIPLLIRNTLQPELAGTRVDGDSSRPGGVLAVTALPRVVRRRFRPAVGQRTALSVFDSLKQPPLHVAWETPGQTLSMIVPEADEPSLTAALAQHMDTEAACREEVSLVAVMDGSGSLFSATAPAVLSALAKHRIQVKGMFQPAAAFRTLGVLIDRPNLRSAVRLLHQQLISTNNRDGQGSTLGAERAGPHPLDPQLGWRNDNSAGTSERMIG